RFGRGFGFDLSETGVRLGREAGRTRLARATVTAAPLPSGAFDVVTSFDVLYSLQDDAERAALRERYRLLRPGGSAVISVVAMEVRRAVGQFAAVRGAKTYGCTKVTVKLSHGPRLVLFTLPSGPPPLSAMTYHGVVFARGDIESPRHTTPPSSRSTTNVSHG